MDRELFNELLDSFEYGALPAGNLMANQGNDQLPEPKKLRERAGMQIDEFAKCMGVSVAQVKKWEANSCRPSSTAQKLMRLLNANPYLSRQLLES
ncbi:helix-turn-helix domain-containing protein [Chimaeribacter arupi]|uniref:Helix-turn-helix domain-containing protein n=2 Tax=Yersiniaceae TaxID=1903411 RepID=A0A2N5ELD0_9GAMM|nr:MULTISPECIES: helix-turn-helix domain-containing protein [Yersiniaceae]MBS0967909.1 helix-turn-helix domain-containing protein [Nissabacter archeti]MDV5142526.1 helix-turn-helix domain-containing protein [Chimaeribacter arupi]PLR37152.1 helix-turn-helix domain-containing protein [Chimaeribacter arupi]PLR45550.1 helix-turn-helix domain-containing protein [Chimaeribacter arupi]PLR48003.1 helix-turn-helix domain-containing protein [Chimaeribacter arupi]